MRARWPALVAAACVSGACASHRVAYAPPQPDVPPAAEFKEYGNLRPAAPQDAVIRGDWWEMFGDPQLNALEERLTVSNETLRAAAAQFAQAQAILRTARAAQYPQVNAVPQITPQQPSGNRAISTFHSDFTDFVVPVTASYEADVWGRVHEVVSASRASAQATAADLENARLSLHAELAADYFALRGLDSERQLLDAAVTAYEQALQLTQNRFQGGIASAADVAQAETQLETTRAEAVDVDSERVLVEHAIAVLIGASASAFGIPAAPLAGTPPDIPAGIPSALLERRPDIAGAERRVAAATAQLGATTAAYYPVLNLAGATGFESTSLATLFTATSNFWAFGPVAVATLFDAGRRRAQIDQARAFLEQTAANYQATVLSAFREVEDQVATLRILQDEAAVQDRAVDASARALAQANNRYAGGVASYLEVIVAQTASLNNERTAARILTRRMTSSVLLLRGIGGGWNQSALPSLQ